MILKDELGNEYEFTGHDIEIESGRWGRLKNITKPKYVEGALVNVTPNSLDIANKGIIERNESVMNIPDEILIKTIVQNWFPECKKVVNTCTSIYFYGKADIVLGIFRTYNSNLARHFPEIEINRI